MVRKNAAARRRARAARTERQAQPTRRGNTSAAVAVARAPAVQPAGTLRQKGTDRLGHVEKLNEFAAGDTVFAKVIEPVIAERLGRLSELFQRIRYNSLRIEVRSQTSTSTGGGYVAGFIRDPDAYTEGASVLNHIAGLTGSKTANWWQSVVLDVGRTPDLMYTNSSSSKQMELKHVSPGVLVICCDGKATTEGGGLTILLHWDVTLSEPSLFGEDSAGPGATITLEDNYTFWDFENDVEHTWRVALTRGDKNYVMPEELGIRPGTIWKTRPYTFIAEGPADNWFKCFNTEYVVVVDDRTNGSIRPAVKIIGDGYTRQRGGRIVDATDNFGSFTYWHGGPAIAGNIAVFHTGDVWTEVDATGAPINSGRLSYAKVEQMRREGLLPAIVPENNPLGMHGPRGKIAHLEAKLSGKSPPSVSPTKAQRALPEEAHFKESMEAKQKKRREKREAEFLAYIEKLKKLREAGDPEIAALSPSSASTPPADTTASTKR